MVRFLVDAQLPPDLARVLRENGFDAVAVREVGLRDANDVDSPGFFPGGKIVKVLVL